MVTDQWTQHNVLSISFTIKFIIELADQCFLNFALKSQIGCVAVSEYSRDDKSIFV